MDLTVSQERLDEQSAAVGPDEGFTGIYVRATIDGKWGSYDIATLDDVSLAAFVRSRGDVSDWGMSVITGLLKQWRA